MTAPSHKTESSHRIERPILVLVRILGLSLVALAILLTFRPAAEAQQVCMTRAELSSLLGDRFEEVRVARGLASTGRMIEVFASADGTTWTLVVTTAEGESCVVASGEAWDQETTRPAADQPA